MTTITHPGVRALAAVLVALAAVLGAVTTASQPARADVGEEGCHDDIAVGLVSGVLGSHLALGATVYSNVRDPCFAQHNTVADVDTRAEAKRRIAQLALEDRRYLVQYFDQFDANTDRLENPAYLDGKTAFVAALQNGSTETHAITLARRAVHNRTAAQQRVLWLHYRSVLDTIEHLELQARDEQVANESLFIGHVENGSFVGGYSLANYSERGATVTVTLTNGETVTVPAPYRTENGTVTDTLHPITDDVAITVYNPETGTNQTIINNAVYVRTLLDTDPGDDYTTTFSEQVGTVEAIVHNGQYHSVGLHFGQYRFMIANENTWNVWKNGTSVAEFAGGTDSTITISLSDAGVPTFTASGTTYEATDPVTNQTLIVDEDGTNDDITNLTVRASHDTLDSYANEFETRHDRLETVDDTVIDGLGNETQGFLHDVHTNVDLGNINYSDVFTPYDRYRLSVEPSDVGEQSWLAYQYASLGYGGANVSSTISVTVLAGSVVDGSTIASNMTVEGQLFTDATPPGGRWQAGQNYTVGGSSADLATAVYIQRTVTTSVEENGTLVFRTEGRTTTITSGEIVVERITNSDGTTIETAAHTNREPASTDVSNLTRQINTLQRTIETLRERIDEDDDGNTPDGGTAGGGGDNPLTIDLGALFPEVTLPWSSASVNLAAVGIALVALAGVAIVLTDVAGLLVGAFGFRD